MRREMKNILRIVEHYRPDNLLPVPAELHSSHIYNGVLLANGNQAEAITRLAHLVF